MASHTFGTDKAGLARIRIEFYRLMAPVIASDMAPAATYALLEVNVRKQDRIPFEFIVFDYGILGYADQG